MLEVDADGIWCGRSRCKLDFGANEWVLTPSTAEAYPVGPSIETRNGINFVAANDASIKNNGQKTWQITIGSGMIYQRKMEC